MSTTNYEHSPSIKVSYEGTSAYLAVSISIRKLLSVSNAHRTTMQLPATSPASRKAKGTPTMPLPTMHVTKLATVPPMPLLASSDGLAFFLSVLVPPGLWTSMRLRGVEGLKKGSAVAPVGRPSRLFWGLQGGELEIPYVQEYGRQSIRARYMSLMFQLLVA